MKHTQPWINFFFKSLFSICTAAVLFTACQKDGNNGNNNSNPKPDSTSKVYLIKSYTNDADGEVFSYTYDNKNRVVKEVRSLDDILEYAYNDTSVIETRFDLNGNFTEKNEYRLDTNGLAKSGKHKTYTEFYTYNSARQNTRTYSESYDANGKVTNTYDTKNYYTNGNLDSTITTFFNGVNSTTYPEEYYDSYYTDKPNILDYANVGSAWFGKGNKNLPKSGRSPSSVPGLPMQSFNLTYQYDSLGRISKIISSANKASSGMSNIVYY